MSTIAVPFDENAIGPSLALTNSDTTLQTTATVDAHRMARSEWGQATDLSSVEFYLYSPNGGNPSLATDSGVPPVSVGVVDAEASVSLYVGEDAHGWGYAPGDGKVRNNGTVLYTWATTPINSYITVAIDPQAGNIVWSANGIILGTINVTPFTAYYAATVKGAPGDIGLDANAGQTPVKYPVTNSAGWLHKVIGIVPLYLATEPYITPPDDSDPNEKYNGDIDRTQQPTTISRAAIFWPWGASMPSTLASGAQAQINLLDPNGIYGELIESDIRDQFVTMARLDQETSADAAEQVFTGIVDHCEQTTDQTKTLYIRDKSTLLQSQLVRPLFAPNADPSVAGKPRPIAWGICRTFNPALYDSTNFYYAIGDMPVTQFGFLRINGAPMQAGSYTVTTDAEGVDLTDAPDGAFTADTSTYAGEFSIAANDYLSGLGAFGTCTPTGSPAIPTGWTAGFANYQTYYPVVTGWHVTGTSPNQVLECANYGNMAWLKETTYRIKAGRSYAFKFTATQVPAWSTTKGIYSTVTGQWESISPAQIVLGYHATPAQGFSSFATVPLSTVGDYIAVFTNQTGADQDFVFGFLCNPEQVPGSKVKISSVYLNELPPMTFNIPLNGPGLDASLQNFMIAHGPLVASDYDSSGALAIDADTGYQYGLHVSESESPQVQACVKQFLDSPCAASFPNRSGVLDTVRLFAPEDATAVAGSLTVTDINGYLQPFPDLAENLTTRMDGARNYNPLTESDFANVTDTSLTLQQRKALESNYQWTVTGGIRLAARYRAAELAPALPSCFDRIADGQDAITHVCKLYSVPRNFYVGTFFSPVGRSFDVGEVWNVTNPIAGLESGRQLLIVGVQDQPSSELSTLTFWGL